MSSILKALKKVEDKNPGTKGVNPWLRKSAGRKTAQKYTAPPRRSRPLLLAVAAVILLVIIVWFSAPQQSTELSAPATVSETAGPQDITQAPTAPVKTLTADSAPRPAAPPAEVKTITTKQAETTLQQPGKDLIPALPTPAKDLPAKVEAVVVPPTSREKEVVAPPVSKTPAVDIGLPAPAVINEAPQAPLLPDMGLLDNSVLKLQAITWSANPDNRFVLINNRILRRGESISGFTLVRIEEDHVVLKSGQEYWRLEFRIR